MSPSRPKTVYPRARTDALTDGIYAVAMTLLVLDIRLPDDFQPGNASQLLDGLWKLEPRAFPYVLSFLVLGARWLASVRVQTRAEAFDDSYVRWWLLQLLLVTCVPFTTIVVGRFASFAPAIWLYAGNTALIALAQWRLLTLMPDVENERHRQGRKTSVLLLMVSALLCIAWSFVNPQQALWFLILNLAGPALAHRSGGSATTQT